MACTRNGISLTLKLSVSLKGSCNVPVEDDFCSVQTQHEKKDLTISPRTFVGAEIFDGKAVIIISLIQLYRKPFIL